MKKYDVIIYGAGFAGLSQAISLSGILGKILLVEPLPKGKYIKYMDADTRTTALSYNSKKFYEELGIWENFSDKVGAIDDIRIVDADYSGGESLLKLHFSSDNVDGETMGYIIENNIFKGELYNIASKIDNIDIEFGRHAINIENAPDSVSVVLDNEEKISGQMLIAADGRNSKLRSYMSIDTIDKDYNQSAITFNIRHKNSHKRMALEKFLPTGPFAVLPMCDEFESSVVWSVKRSHVDYYMSMEEAELKSYISDRLGGYLGDFELISKPLSFPLSLKYTKRYFEGRFVMIGDVCHAIHPIAGQGFNQGIKDIQKLSKLIAERMSYGLDVYSQDMLKLYQSTAFSDNIQMILATDSFNSLFSNDNSLLKMGRRVGISAVDRVNVIKKFFIKRAMGA